MAAGATDRRGFLFGRFGVEAPADRPPWAAPRASFINLCNRCGDCIRVCPSEILVPGDGGFPTVDFALGACTFCGDCVRVCDPGALGPMADDAGVALTPWSRIAVIDDSCLAARGVVCRVCEEQCESRAIRIRLVVGGGAVPTVEPALCTGCGACVAPCPAYAVAIHPIDHRQKAH
jgi:ferredoxin-type protein NapF